MGEPHDLTRVTNDNIGIDNGHIVVGIRTERQTKYIIMVVLGSQIFL